MVPRYGTIRSDRRLIRAACALTHVPFKPRDHAPDSDEDVGPQEREPERHDAEQRPAFKGLHTRRNKEVLREKERYEAEYQKYEVLLVLTYRKRRENKTGVNGRDRRGSNPQPPDPQSGALPIELRPPSIEHSSLYQIRMRGARKRPSGQCREALST